MSWVVGEISGYIHVIAASVSVKELRGEGASTYLRQPLAEAFELVPFLPLSRNEVIVAVRRSHEHR